jgi:hypothetical protein
MTDTFVMRGIRVFAPAVHGAPAVSTGGSSFDAATLAWVAAVIAHGGTVSATQEGYVDTLIVGLKADGLFSKLDRLWLFASENQDQALVDIIADASATNVNSTTFTANVGYTGGSGTYIDSNFNPTTAPSPHYIQDSASLFGWNNTDTGVIQTFISLADIPNSKTTELYPDNTGAQSTLWDVNTAFARESFTGPVHMRGLWVMSRTGANAETIDLNGTQLSSGNTGSTTPANSTFWALGESFPAYTTAQACCVGFGSGLTGTDRTNLYARLRTYMTSVGVP